MTTPDTIVLIHGFWVTPRSWEDWIAHYEAKGFRVLAPAYPGFEVEVEALNADPTPIEALTVPQIVEHLEAVVGGARLAADHHGPLGRRRVHPDPARPRLRRRRRGHQLGADRGRQDRSRCRRSGRRSRCSRTRPTATGPSGFTPEQWHYAFTNTFSDEESQRLYERYHIPASGHIFWGSVLANIHPGHDDTWVDYHNEARAPLLFISGDEDHLMPPKIQQSNAKHYKAPGTITEIKEFAGPAPAPVAAGLGGGRRLRPRLGARPRRRRGRRVTDVRLTHIGGPTVLLEVDGWRLLTDPTFDPPGRRYRFGWGTSSRKLAGPAVAADDIGPIDAVLLTHDHHADNLDDAGRALLADRGAP